MRAGKQQITKSTRKNTQPEGSAGDGTGAKAGASGAAGAAAGALAVATGIISRQAAGKVILIKTYGNVCE